MSKRIVAALGIVALMVLGAARMGMAQGAENMLYFPMVVRSTITQTETPHYVVRTDAPNGEAWVMDIVDLPAGSGLFFCMNRFWHWNGSEWTEMPQTHSPICTQAELIWQSGARVLARGCGARWDFKYSRWWYYFDMEMWDGMRWTPMETQGVCPNHP